jgi:5,10-methylenetetrahydrofolate reductase
MASIATNAALALNRFGFGARPGEPARVESDPRAWLRAQITTPPPVFIGAAANPFAPPFDFRPINLAKKIEAGAQFIQTQTLSLVR